MRPLSKIALAGAASLACLAAFAQAPAGYPASYGETVGAAKKEGKVVIYSTTDTAAANFLVKDFQALYPGITVEYNDMNSTEVYNRFISEKAANAGSADVLWSSSMDLQIKLANEGGALAYASPEIAALPSWAGGRTRPSARPTSRSRSSTTSGCWPATRSRRATPTCCASSRPRPRS